MRLYAVALVIWVATITASSVSNIANFSDEKAVGYTEFPDLLAKQIVQPYVTGIEARSSGQTSTEDHFTNDAANVGLSRSTARVGEETESNGVSTIDLSLSESIYATPLNETTDKYPNHQPGYTIPEDVLLVENAGKFGQKVRQRHLGDRTIVKTTILNTVSRKDDKYANVRKSFSSTVSPLEDEDHHRRLIDGSRPIYVSTTQEPFVFALKNGSNMTDDSSSDDFKVIGSKTSAKNSDETFNAGSTTENLPSSKTNNALENDVVPENLPTPQARSSRVYNDTADKIIKKPAESIKKSENIAGTSVEISPSLQTRKFSGPIVVADLPDREEMVIDYLDDNDASGTFKSIENAGIILEAKDSKITATNGITTSSIMLNPLQVGIALVNADKTILVDDSDKSAATDTKEYLRNDQQRLTIVGEESVENIRNQSYGTYKDKNLSSVEEERPVDVITQKVPDNSVEIQKSIELYHTAPVHEIHYPPEYVQQTTNLGVIETNSLGSLQRSRQPYGQNEQSKLRSNYDIYRGNDQVEKGVIKTHASTLSQKLNRHEYNTLADDVGKPIASTLVAEYSSNTYEQTPLELSPYNDVQSVLLVPNQYDTSYDQSNVRHNFNGNDNSVSSYAKPIGSATKQEITSELVQPYVQSTTYQEQQQQLNQPIDHQHPFRSSEMRQPEVPQLLLRIIPHRSSTNGGFLVPIPRPYPIEKIIEKTIHVPHPIEIEKVIEKKVPFPVERLIEKQVQVQVPVAIPQPYPVHIQVPVDRVIEKHVPHVYPIHIERMVEKRVPYAVQRLPVQAPSYPLHVRLSSSYPTHLSTHVTAPIEKTTEKSPYRADAEKLTGNRGSIETKFNKYHQKVSREPVFADGFAFEAQPQSEANVSQFSVPYSRPLTYNYYNVDVDKNYVPAAQISNIRLMILPKKSGNRVVLRSHTTTPPYATPVSLTRQIVYNLVEKDKAIKDEYVGPAPPRKILQGKTFPQVKSPQFSTSATQSSATIATLRRSRQPETQYTGSFRQSKMEYGFKPPMVPSVQYDEKTATEVEN